jgi:hypothetical protein
VRQRRVTQLPGATLDRTKQWLMECRSKYSAMSQVTAKELRHSVDRNELPDGQPLLLAL